MGVASRLAVINPNSNAAVTAIIRQAVQEVLNPATELLCVNSDAGPKSIELPEHRVAAIPHWHAKLLQLEAEQPDAYVLACYDEFGLAQARQLVDRPIIGAVEASIAFAQVYAERYAIITTMATTLPSIYELVVRYGAQDRCVVRATGLGVAQAAASELDVMEVLVASARELIAQAGVGALILGSGGLAGRAGYLAERVGVPVIDAVVSAAKMAEAVAGMRKSSVVLAPQS